MKLKVTYGFLLRSGCGDHPSTHLHGFRTLHLPVPHTDRTHHAHHALSRGQLTLGVDEKVAAGHNPLPLRETTHNPHIFVCLRPESHLARLQTPLPLIDKDQIASTGVEHCTLRYDELLSQIHAEFHVGVHARLKPQAWVGNTKRTLLVRVWVSRY